MDYEKEAKNLVNRMCQVISSNCEHEAYCQKPQCEWNGMILCVVAQNEAKRGALICCDVVIANNKVLLDTQLNNDFSLLGNSVDWGRIKEAIEKM